MTYFKVLSLNLPGETGENGDKPQSTTGNSGEYLHNSGPDCQSVMFGNPSHVSSFKVTYKK
jgi:hypothetical protein